MHIVLGHYCDDLEEVSVAIKSGKSRLEMGVMTKYYFNRFMEASTNLIPEVIQSLYNTLLSYYYEIELHSKFIIFVKSDGTKKRLNWKHKIIHVY